MSPAAIAALAAALAYLPSLAGAFQFDDYNVIIGDPAVHSWGALAADAGTGIRPLLKASYALSWTMGLGAVGFHLFNIAVHALNAALVVLVGRALCRRWLVPTYGDQLRLVPMTDDRVETHVAVEDALAVASRYPRR